MWEALVPLGASLISGLFGSEGQDSTNTANIELGQKQMDFQERMSNTAYERAVGSMQKAGLNPMLAYSQGGASAPAGSMPQVQNAASAGVSSAAQGAALAQALQSVAQSKSQTAMIDAQADKIRSETMEKNLNTAMLAAQVKDVDMRRLSTEARIPGERADSDTKLNMLTESMRPGSYPGSAFAADVSRRKTEALLAQLEVNKARAESKFWGTDAGAGSPYLKPLLDILKGLSIGAGALKK
ncbi:MAG: DNA pilot protein [Arizlama microvirus]|nr:MAG: DNA pilot protein [Arizlama microvirus]